MDTPRHLTIAKCLLEELDQRATHAIEALYRNDGAALDTALDERNHLLVELDQVVTTLAHERDWTSKPHRDLAAAAAAALESQQDLLASISMERNRLATALRQTERRDAVADQYAPTPVQRPSVVSVIG